ncbi:MAG: type II secretion system minor pseudopilin GspJ [Burkholderiales bacterium]
MRSPRGFTLLEMLVAIGIFALLSAMAYGGLIRVLDTRDRLEAQRDFWRGLSVAFVQIEDDLFQTRARTVRDVYGNPQPAMRGQPVDSRALGEPSLEFTRGGRFVLGQAPLADLQRVGYRLHDGTLWRLIWPALDQPAQSEPRESPLLGNIEEMRLRFYAPAGAWVDYWPPENQARGLPLAVEISLTIAGHGQFVRLLRVNG